VVRAALRDASVAPALLSVDSRFSGDIDRLSFSAAVRLTSRISLGGSFNLWRGRWGERTTFAEPSGPSSSDFVSARSDWEVHGENATAGLLLTWPRVHVGAVYHFAFGSDLALRQEIRSNLQPTETYDGGPRGRFRFPRLFAVGAAWHPAAQWTLAADVTHDQWTDTLLTGLAGLPPSLNFFDSVPPEFSTTRDTTTLNLGAEHLFLREGAVLPLRVGFGWEPQGGMDPVTRDPVGYHMVSFGGGYNTNHLKFDAAVQYRWSSYETSEVVSVHTFLADGRDAVGRGHASEWRFKLSAIYRLPKPD
jgi:hypothetical protein